MLDTPSPVRTIYGAPASGRVQEVEGVSAAAAALDLVARTSAGAPSLWESVSKKGPQAVLDVAGSVLGDLTSVAGWVVGLVVGTVVLRFVARRLIARITHRFAEGRRPAVLRWAGRLLRRGERHERVVAAANLLGAPLSDLAARREQRTKAIGSLATSLASLAIVVGALTFAAVHIGIPGGAVFSAGLLGMGTAVVFQGLAKDLLAGMFLLIEDTYGVGDYVDVNLGASGVVEEIGLRTTRLRGPDGTVWYVRHGEMLRVGNRTQEQTKILLDITVGFPSSPDRPSAVGPAELVQAENLVRRSIARLDRDLTAAAQAGTKDEPEMPTSLVALVPELVPDVPTAELETLSKDALEATGSQPGLAAALSHLLEDVDVPVLTETAVLGLAGSDPTSVTLRVRARVADTSREQALAVLRRRMFVDVTREGLSVTFTHVDPSALT